ncbi:putative succinyl-diaminopimelate desuccinylase [Corynebacterium kalinowskii]|uniref:Succinyl-diaminopimelate desuccinylase n=1 Tax=Corynebacterium kalinowskii TaxID=2675216 RepID=A0A6B8VR48_9CORY|nr:dipeptidase [Corynebacterium kalinowskii]QGU01236.1 putative succinyl-diaminopimelate desuccinylase [Corynebacterium kalinowskii]
MTFANTDAVRAHITGQRDRIFQDLAELTSFNSVHSTPELEDQLMGAADWVEQALTDAGLDVTSHDGIDGARIFIATKAPEPGQPTVLLYSHYDVVPAGDLSKWTNDPFTLTERDGRWYARGAADCKGNLVMHLAVLRALKELGNTNLGLRVVIEGSEEMGGEGLDHLIDTRPELFAADVIFIADTGNVSVGTPTLTTSLRGGGQMQVTLDTLNAPVHSGSFGGAAPDAVFAMVRLLDTLRDDNGLISIDGLDCSQTWPGLAYPEEDFRSDAGILDGVSVMGSGVAGVADQVWARPAVSITGWTSTPVAEAVNAVPATCSVNLQFRVPPGQSSAQVAEALEAHLRAHVPWGAHISISTSGLNDPFSTDTASQAVEFFSQCMASAYGKDVVTVGAGGSIPLCEKLQSIMPSAAITLFGVEEPSCLIHSPDESVAPEEIRDVAIAEALFLLNYAK